MNRLDPLRRRHKGAVLIFAFLGALAGLLVSLPQTPIYEARTSLEIESLNENFLDLANVNPTASGGAYSTELEISTQVKVLESRSLLEKVVDKLKLAERPEFSYEPGRISAWRKALSLPPSRATTIEPGRSSPTTSGACRSRGGSPHGISKRLLD